MPGSSDWRAGNGNAACPLPDAVCVLSYTERDSQDHDSFEGRSHARVDDSGSVRTGTDSDVGLWNVKDDAITLASTRGVISRTGVVSGNAITLQSSIRVFALTKRQRWPDAGKKLDYRWSICSTATNDTSSTGTAGVGSSSRRASGELLSFSEVTVFPHAVLPAPAVHRARAPRHG